VTKRPRQDSNLRHRLRRVIRFVQVVFSVYSSAPEQDLQSKQTVAVFLITPIRLPILIAKRTTGFVDRSSSPLIGCALDQTGRNQNGHRMTIVKCGMIRQYHVT